MWISLDLTSASDSSGVAQTSREILTIVSSSAATAAPPPTDRPAGPGRGSGASPCSGRGSGAVRLGLGERHARRRRRSPAPRRPHRRQHASGGRAPLPACRIMTPPTPRVPGARLADQREDLARGLGDVGARAEDRGDAGLAAGSRSPAAGSRRRRSRGCRRRPAPSAPRSASAPASCGPPPGEEMPTTCTSLSTASCAASSGVWNSGPDVDVEADVGEGGGDHLGAAVVAVLAHLDDQHPRPPALLLGEGLDVRLDRRRSPRRPRRPRRRRPARVFTSARCRPNTFSIASEISPTVARARAASTAAASRLPPSRAAALDAGDRRRPGRRVARRRGSARAAPPAPRAPATLSTSRMSIGSCCASRYLLTPTITSSPRSTAACRRAAALLDPQLRHPARSPPWSCRRAPRPPRSAPRPRSASSRRQALDVVGAGQRIDDMGDPGLLLQDQLGVAGDAGGEFRRQGNRFVERVGVQALRAARAPPPSPRRRCARRCCRGPAPAG